VRRQRELLPWLLVPLVLAAGGGVGALLAVHANSRDRIAKTVPVPLVAPAPLPTQNLPTAAAPAPAAVTVPRAAGEKASHARKALREAGRSHGPKNKHEHGRHGPKDRNQ
jgi:hypothetical protein